MNLLYVRVCVLAIHINLLVTDDVSIVSLDE